MDKLSTLFTGLSIILISLRGFLFVAQEPRPDLKIAITLISAITLFSIIIYYRRINGYKIN